MFVYEGKKTNENFFPFLSCIYFWKNNGCVYMGKIVTFFSHIKRKKRCLT